MKRPLIRNPGLKLLAITLAVWIWYSAAYEPEVAATLAIPVQYRNLPAHLEISNGFTNTVLVETRGPAGRLRRLSGVETAVILDFSTVKEPGERTFAIGPRQVSLPHGVTLLRAIPAQLRFEFEKSALRAVPVNVRFTGSLEEGLKIEAFEADPKELVITGPASSVSAVELLETDPVNLSGVKQDVQQMMTVFAPQPGVRFASGSRVMVKVHVKRSGT